MQLVVSFSEGIIDLTPENSTMSQPPDFIHLEPAINIAGQWTWEDPQTLTCKTNRLPGSTAYSFSVNQGLLFPEVDTFSSFIFCFSLTRFFVFGTFAFGFSLISLPLPLCFLLCLFFVAHFIFL